MYIKQASRRSPRGHSRLAPPNQLFLSGLFTNKFGLISKTCRRSSGPASRGLRKSRLGHRRQAKKKNAKIVNVLKLKWRNRWTQLGLRLNCPIAPLKNANLLKLSPLSLYQTLFYNARMTTDNPSQELQPVAQTEAKKPFNFREELGAFFQDGVEFPDYYDIEAGHNTPKESIASQVCTRVEYETIVKNDVEENTAESLLVPVESKRSVIILAPPVVPHVIDEFMPQDLWEVVKSDDQSVAPTLDELKCVEIGVYGLNTFKNGDTRKSGEIYRVDLTKDQPVLYKRYPIPKNQQEKRDAMGTDEDAQILSALLDFIQPLPAYKYEQVDSSELETIVEIIKDCRKGL